MRGADLGDDAGEQIIQRLGGIWIDGQVEVVGQFADQGVDFLVDAAPGRSAGFVEAAIVVNGRVQGLADILGVVGQQARIDEALGADVWVVGPGTVLGQCGREALGPFDDGIGRQPHLIGPKIVPVAPTQHVKAAGGDIDALEVLEIEIMLR